MQKTGMKRLVALSLILLMPLAGLARPKSLYTPEEARAVRSAAELGNADAQFDLGALYRVGNGVPLDVQEASRWFRRAANQGHTVAQLNLGVLYAYGEGVPKDLVQAHMWLSIAEAKQHKDAKRMLLMIAKEMTEAQKEEATEKAKELTEKLAKQD